MKNCNKPTAADGSIPGQIVMCQAANNGNGLRIGLYRAVTKERPKSYVCDGCAARVPCKALHAELVRLSR